MKHQALNDLLHYGVQVDAEKRQVVSNRRVALTLDRVRETPISPELLDALTYDLTKIQDHLVHLLIVGDAPKAVADERFAELPRAEWQYKSEAPFPSDPRRSPESPKRSSRRGSSRE